MKNFKHPDLHMHSTYSDGSDTPFELLSKVRQSSIDIFSLTDHDTYLGCCEITKNLCNGDPLFIGGIELSCMDEYGKYHILGYCYDVNKSSIKEAVEITHNARRNKAINRFDYLERFHNFSFNESEKQEILSNENPGKPHFVSLLLKKNYIKDKSQGFSLMDKYHGKERRLTPKEAIDAILSSDGIPVLAHGIFEDGRGLLAEHELSERIKRLKSFGLMGLECFYSSYTNKQSKIMVSLAHQYNLLATAGSDYHGINKTVPIGASGNPTYEIMDRFYQAVYRLFL